MKRYSWITAPVFAVVVLAVACGGAAAPTATPTKAPAATAPPAPAAVTTAPAAATAAPAVATPTPTRAAAQTPTATPAAIAAGKPKPKGTLIMASPDLGYEAIQPYKGISGADEPHQNPMFQSLLFADEKANIVPNLAATWRITQDKLGWEFTIRKDVKMQTGDFFNAEDAKISLEKQVTERLGGMAPWAKTLDKIETPDPSTLLVRFKKPSPMFPRLMSGFGGLMVPGRYVKSVGEDGFVKAPLGMGPFKLTKRDQGSVWEWEAFTDYWAEGPYVQRLIHRVIPDSSTRWAALKVGEVHLITGLSTPTVSAIKADPKLWLMPNPGTGRAQVAFTELGKNPDHPFKNKLVRQAANYAVDKETICNRLWGGECVPAIYDTTPYTWGWPDDPNIKLYPYDPAKAKQLLKEAGYPDGITALFAVREHPAIPSLPEVSQAIAAYWTAVGIKTELVPVESAALITLTYVQRKANFNHVLAGSLTEDPRLTEHLKHTTKSVSVYAAMILADIPDLDAMVDRLMIETDDATARGMWKEIMRYSLEQAVYLEMPAVNTFYGVSKKLQPWPRILIRAYLHNFNLMKLQE